jgi:asparagine synthase (glutamine-hydrolysing)
MCGLAGFWSPTRAASADPHAMAAALSHRGPDDMGSWSDAENGVFLAHSRLAIVDLSAAGHQPMASMSGRYVIVFNGEIYNHYELRAELDAEEQIPWRGHSDTETFIQGIERWGVKSTLERSVGMFAIAIWDRRERKLILARDRLGEKPLYYGWNSGGGFVFGSELKALRLAPGFDNPVNLQALSLYLLYNYVPAPISILQGIFKVEPGTILTISADGAVTPSLVAPYVGSNTSFLSCELYWSLADIVDRGSDETMSESEAVDGLENKLLAAIRRQVVADVPVGAFLSGGVDSTTIVALMREIGATVKTFTIGFDQAGFNEAPYARAVAKHIGTEHHEMYVSADDVRSVIPELPQIFDEPFADSSQIPTVLLSRLTRQSVTVALSGDAGDELFGGYNRYLAAARYQRIAGQLPKAARNLTSRAITAVPQDFWDRISALPFAPSIPMLGNKMHKVARMLRSGATTSDFYRSATQGWDGKPPSTGGSGVHPPLEPWHLPGRTAEEQMMFWDTTSYLPDDILVKIDRASMSASLETRVPFLDHQVVEQAWRTPLQFKIRNGQGKWMLRQILYRRVPQSLIERPKAGFAIPIGQWLRGPLLDWAADLLSDAALADQPALDAHAIKARWAQHIAGSHDWTETLWGVLMFQAWSRAWNAR